MDPSFPHSVPPDPDRLLRLIAARITDAMLEDIAAADYGINTEENTAELRRIRDRGVVAGPMRWIPREVLELIRWSEPDQPGWKPGADGIYGHSLRAFACAALLRAAGEHENEELRVGWNQTLIQLIGSLHALESQFDEATFALLVWLTNGSGAPESTDELGFFLVGLIWSAGRLKSPPPDAFVLSLIDRAIELGVKHPKNYGRHRNRWLLGTTLFDQRHHRWETLGRCLSTFDSPAFSTLSVAGIRRIGHLLSVR